MPAEKRRVNSARLREAEIRALEQIGQDAHRAETIREAAPMRGAVRTAVALRIGPGGERTGRRALVRGLLGEISALLLHQGAIGRKVIARKRGHALKVVRPKGRAEHAHTAGVAQGSEGSVRVSTVRARKAVAAGVAKAVRLARIKVGLRARSDRRSERVGRAWIVRAWIVRDWIARALKVREAADPARIGLRATIVQLSEMIGQGLIDRGEKAMGSRVAKGGAVRGANLVRIGLNAIGLSAVRSNGPGHRARAAVSDRANPAQRAGGRAEFVQAAGDGQVLALPVLARVVLERADLVQAASVLRVLVAPAHGQADLDRAAARARTSAGLDLGLIGKLSETSRSTMRTCVQGEGRERNQDCEIS
jgi:hypothetical protein